MRHLLFKLHDVPEDEAAEVRALLGEHGIRFYETDAGRWRIGLAAIWLPDEQQKAEAQALLAVYQEKRYGEARAATEQLRGQGFMATFLLNLYQQPARVLAALLGIGIVLAISILPFILL